MSKKTLLSALLISSLGLSTVFGADAVDPKSSAVAGTNGIVFYAKGKHLRQPVKQESQSTVPEKAPFTSLRPLTASGETYETFPFAQNTGNADAIIIEGCQLKTINPEFYRGNSALVQVSFNGSTVNLNVFEGHKFLDGCDNTSEVSLVDAEGINFDTFLREYASATLLKRILNKECTLRVSCNEPGTTAARFMNDGIYTQEIIRMHIKTSGILDRIANEKTTMTTPAAPPSKTWYEWLLGQ
jgi:hypothetical protein